MIARLPIAVAVTVLLWAVPPPPQLPTTLLHEADFTFLGAGKMPDSTSNATGPMFVYNPANNSFIVGQGGEGHAFEMSIPTLATPTGEATFDSGNNIQTPVLGLNAGSIIQSMRDTLNGQGTDIEGEEGNGFGAGGGIVVDGSDMYKVLWAYFDSGTQQRAIFKTGTNFSSLPTILGPYAIDSNQPASFADTIGVNWQNRIFVPITPQWQSALGGNAIVGQHSAPIASQHSHGPNAHVIDLSDVGSVNPVPSTIVMGYPTNHTTVGCDGRSNADPPDLCRAFATNTSNLWNEGAHLLAYAFIKDTATLVIAGKIGTGEFCYGSPTDEPSLHLTPHPSAPTTETWCYAPFEGIDKGIYTYPYGLYFLLYDVNDLVAVKNGSMEAWEVVPYEWFDVTMPHMMRMNATFYYDGFAYDPTNQRLYLKHAQGGGTNGTASTFWAFGVTTTGGGGGGGGGGTPATVPPGAIQNLFRQIGEAIGLLEPRPHADRRPVTAGTGR